MPFLQATKDEAESECSSSTAVGFHAESAANDVEVGTALVVFHDDSAPTLNFTDGTQVQLNRLLSSSMFFNRMFCGRFLLPEEINISARLLIPVSKIVTLSAVRGDQDFALRYFMTQVESEPGTRSYIKLIRMWDFLAMPEIAIDPERDLREIMRSIKNCKVNMTYQISNYGIVYGLSRGSKRQLKTFNVRKKSARDAVVEWCVRLEALEGQDPCWLVSGKDEMFQVTSFILSHPNVFSSRQRAHVLETVAPMVSARQSKRLLAMNN
jgi:hypothetical protein